MANEILHIENFAGIKNADIELGRMNVFIGPQASGKSVCAKLIYFFRRCIANLSDHSGSVMTKSAINASNKQMFSKFFPRDSWSKGNFIIRYAFNEHWIEVSSKSMTAKAVEITYSPIFDSWLNTFRKLAKSIKAGSDMVSIYEAIHEAEQKNAGMLNENWYIVTGANHFIPAGRSFFSVLRSSVFQFIANDLEIDPFLVEYGKFYEFVRRKYMQEIIAQKPQLSYASKILKGRYSREQVSNRDYLIIDDGRKVSIENCSSGQQETLPLILGLLGLSVTPEKAKANTVFIEEPEAHLYPTAQREIVHFIASTIDFVSEDSTSQCVITTHSPYILTALNNLMYAGRIAEKLPDKRKQVNKVIEENAWISPSKVRAYFFENGEVRSIIDPETQLIEAGQLDRISTELAVEFERLLDIEYIEAAA